MSEQETGEETMARLGQIGGREILYTTIMASIGAWTHRAWQQWDGKDPAELGEIVEKYARSADAGLSRAMSKAKSATDGSGGARE